MNRDLLIPELAMFITKSAISPDGTMRWAAVNSDIDWDLYGERMSLELYQKMIGYIKTNTPPPAQFKSAVCSDYWCGGMPYLSIAHYGDGNGKAVPGEVMELFVDGGRLKAKGIYFPNDLGKAVYKSVEEDEYINPQDEDKIRISIGFLDLAHKHGDDGNVFHRKSLTSVCPDCIKGVGDKIYLDGYLVHLALTRVPVNIRTEMRIDRGMANKPKTKKQDALSVVKNEALVDEIVTENGVENKSVLVEMSDAETGNTETVTDTSKLEVAVTIDVPTLVEDSRPSKTGEDEPTEDEEKEPMYKKSEIYEIVKSALAEALPIAKGVAVAEAQTLAIESAPVTQKSLLDTSVDELYTSIQSAVENKSLSLEGKLQLIQPQLEKLGQNIITTVKSSHGEVADTVSNDGGMTLQVLQELSNSVKTGFEAINNKIAILEEKALSAPNIEQPRVPVPRSINPNLVSQALQAKAQTAPKPGSVAEYARRSVGLQS